MTSNGGRRHGAIQQVQPRLLLPRWLVLTSFLQIKWRRTSLLSRAVQSARSPAGRKSQTTREFLGAPRLRQRVPCCAAHTHTHWLGHAYYSLVDSDLLFSPPISPTAIVSCRPIFTSRFPSFFYSPRTRRHERSI